MRKNTVFGLALFLALGYLALNLPLSYRVGIDGVIYTKNIPLYAKLGGYLYRDWSYRDIVKGIVRKGQSDGDKAVAIMRWVKANIQDVIPPGLAMVDDHPLNIIIRQYGTKGQLEDIFTILCNYAGMKGGARKCYNRDRTDFAILSFVRADGRLLIFKASENKHFRNDKGEIASVEDYLDGRADLSEEEKRSYGKYFDDLKNIDDSLFLRADGQMPSRRIQSSVKERFYKEQRR